MSQLLEAIQNQTLLVHTKLRRPRSVGQLVRRPRLLDLLHRGVVLPLTIVSAPPGYGKTTLISLWLGEIDIPWAWYSIGEEDDSLDIFATYLAAALATAYPGFGTAMQSVLQSPREPQPQRLADVFISELDDLPGELVLVLDDYHAITNPEIHSFMSAVIQNAPAGVHFVLLVRSDPPLKLARLRAGQQVLEVRAAQLRFMPDEISELMQRIMGELATDETITLFTERTEGWAAGIHLAATSMRDSSDAKAFALGFARSSSKMIADYLVSEVLEHLSERERTLLLRTAILPRFCAPLCEAIMPQGEVALTGAAFLDRMCGMNLFLIALDDEGTWYRFHHLFADISRHRLRLAFDEATIAELHKAASQWFEAQGLIDEALNHALSAGDAVRAARLIEIHSDNVLNSENWRTLERWIAFLPEAETRRPGVLVAKGWVEQFRYRPYVILALAQEAAERLERNAEQYTASEADIIRGETDAVRALGLMYTAQWGQCRRFVENALTLVPTKSLFVRGIAEFVFLRTTEHFGQPAAAIEQARDWLRQHGDKADARSFRLLLALCAVYLNQLDLNELYATATSYRHLAQRAGHLVSVAWTSWALGFTHYQRNELATAKAYFAEVVRHPYEAHSKAVIECWTGLSVCLQVQGMHEEASRQAGELRQFLLQGGQFELTFVADALAAYVDLLAGQSVRLSDSYAEDLPRQLGLDIWVLPFYIWAVGSIRSALRSQQAKVAAKLAELRSLLATASLPRRLLEVELLEALLQAAQGNHSAALDAVRRAIVSAEPGESLRFFVDMGPDLTPYLHELASQGAAPEFIARILAAFAPENSKAVAPDRPMALLQTNGNAALGPDMLSNRELDVLLLLERRLSNKEIAELLFVSPHTVKRHTVSLYGKLGVDSRRAAVARARALGLMPTA